MVNNIKNNTISEISVKKDLNTLNELKNVQIIKYKKRTPGQKELLNLFNDLPDTILTNKTLKSESQEDENENVNVNENHKTLMSSKDDIENESDKTLISSNDDDDDDDDDDDGDDETLMSSNEDDEDDDETMDQNKKCEIIKGTNDLLDEIIKKSKSFEEQIKSLKKRENLKGFLPYNDFGDKELKSKYFKIELVDMPNEIDEKLIEQIFGYILETLANTLINTTNKEENQIIVKNINKNKDKLYEMDSPSNFLIQPNDQRINLIDAIKLILDFNETIQLDLFSKHKNQKMSE